MDLSKNDVTDSLEQTESAPAGSTAPAAAPNAATDVAPETAAPAAAPPGPAPKATRTIELDPRSLAATKREARHEGRRLEAERLDKLARERGYANHEELLAAVPSKAGVAAPEGVTTEDRANMPVTRRLKMAEQENGQLQKKLMRAAQALKDLQTDMAMREHAYEADVSDVDYAVQLLKRKIGTMAPAELKVFNPKDYFTGLRGSHEFIFRKRAAEKVAEKAAEKIEEPIVDKPVTTSPTARMPADQPTPPRAVEKPAAGDETVDVMKMSNAEYNAYLKRKGVRDPRLSV